MPADVGATEAIVLDLGGVVVEIDFGEAFRVWSAHSEVPVGILRERFSMDESYARHERGEIDATEYFTSLRASLGLRLDDDRIEEGWNAIFLGEFPGVRTLLARLRERVPIYAFSNSNPTHHAVWARRYAETLALFDRVFVSSDLGLRKPEPEAFLAVAEKIGIGTEALLFLDDAHENVAGARAVGMTAEHVTRFADVEAAAAPFLR